MSKATISHAVHWVGLVLLVCSGVLWLLTTIFFVGVWDHVAAVTTFPHWSWATAGVLSAAIAWRLLRPRTRLPIALMILWVVTTIWFADNFVPVIRGLVRGATPDSNPPSGVIRVVTLNCASSAAAAQ